MAMTDVDATMTGIGTNPGLLLRAVDYVADGAEVVYSSNYLGGKAVRAKYHNQKIAETGWLPAGTLNNIVLPTMYIEGRSSVTGSGTDAVSYVDGIQLAIYRRLPGEVGDLSASRSYYKYIDTISNQIGVYPYDVNNNKPATQPYWFDIRYEFKIIIFSDITTSGAWLDVEGIYFRYQQDAAIQAPRQNRISTDDIDSVPIMEGIMWGATSDGSGRIDVQLGSEYFDGTGGLVVAGSTFTWGSTYGYNGVRGVYNSIDGMCTTMYGTPDTTDRPLILNIPYGILDGGLWPDVLVFGLNANSVYTFYTIITGWTTTNIV